MLIIVRYKKFISLSFFYSNVKLVWWLLLITIKVSGRCYKTKKIICFKSIGWFFITENREFVFLRIAWADLLWGGGGAENLLVDNISFVYGIYSITNLFRKSKLWMQSQFRITQFGFDLNYLKSLGLILKLCFLVYLKTC